MIRGHSDLVQLARFRRDQVLNAQSLWPQPPSYVAFHPMHFCACSDSHIFNHNPRIPNLRRPRERRSTGHAPWRLPAQARKPFPWPQTPFSSSPPQFYRPNPRRRPRTPTRPGPASVCVSAFLNTTPPSHATHSAVSGPPPPVRKEDGVLRHPSRFRVYLLAARAALAVIVCGSIVTYQDGIGRNAPAANRYTLRFASGDI